MTHLGDITKIDWFHVLPVDVVTRIHFGEDEWHNFCPNCVADIMEEIDHG